MFSIFVSAGSYHKVQPVPTNLSKPLWLYDSQKRGETFSYVFIDNFHKRENVEQLLFRLPERYRKIFLPFHIFLFFFFPAKQQTLFISHLTVFFQLLHKRHHFKRMDTITLHYPKAVHETDPHIYGRRADCYSSR